MPEIRKEIIDAVVAVMIAVSGMLIAYLHSYTRRFKEKCRENEELKSKLDKKDLKIESLREGSSELSKHKDITGILKEIESRLIKLETRTDR
jgi:hypothetical protein